MIAYAVIDTMLQSVLADTDDHTWDQPMRVRAVNEAIIALGALVPYEFATPVELDYDLTEGAFKIPDEASRLLEIHNLHLADGTCTGLADYTLQQATDADACWQCSDDGKATHFIWSERNPRRVYINGAVSDTDAATTKLNAICSVIPMDLNNNTDNIPVDGTYLPQILDYAQRRLRNVEDTSGPIQTLYQELFERGLNNKATVDMTHNPLRAMYNPTKKR